MRKLAILFALLVFTSLAFGQASTVQYMYTDGETLVTPFLMPDGVTPIPDGCFIQAFMCTNPASPAVNIELDPHGTMLHNDGSIAYTNGVAGEIGAGFFMTEFFVWNDPISDPSNANEPDAECNQDKIYWVVYNGPTPETSTHYRASAIQNAPAVDLTLIIDIAPADWSAWMLLPVSSHNPATPVLTAPANGTTDLVASPLLTWNSTDEYTEGFNVVYGTVMADVAMGMGTVVPAGMLHQYQMPVLPLDGATYYWTVIAFNADRAQTRSNNAKRVSNQAAGRLDAPIPAPWSFTMMMDEPDIMPVTPVAPANGAVDVLNPVVLDWTNTDTTIDGYNVYVNGSMVATINDIMVTEYAMAMLPYDGVAYTWYIESYRDAETAVCATQNFHVYQQNIDGGTVTGDPDGGDTNPNGNTTVTITVGYIVEMGNDVVNGGLGGTNVAGNMYFTINAGGVVTITIDFSGWAPLVPMQWAYFNGTSWVYSPDPSISIVGTVVTFTINQGRGDVEIVWSPTDSPLPVTLSSFSAVTTAENYVKLTWKTQSESNLFGFNVLRSEENTLDSAVRITTDMIEATNSSAGNTYTHNDENVAVGSTYYYWLEIVELDQTVTYNGPLAIEVEGNVTPELPTKTYLSNAYPNPFNPTTTIKFDVKENETASLYIYNVLGQVVKTYKRGAGSHQITWNATDDNGNSVGSGVYFYRLESPSYKNIKKMMLLK